MSTRGKRAAVLLSAPLALLAAGTPPAFAAASAGAQRSVDRGCVDEGDGLTRCYDLTMTYRETVTPSGVRTVTGHVDGSNTFYAADGAVLRQIEIDRSFHRTVKDGVTQVEVMLWDDTAVADGQTGTYTLRLHTANGQVQFSDGGVTCE